MKMKSSLVSIKVEYHFTRATDVQGILHDRLEELEAYLHELGYDVNLEVKEVGRAKATKCALTGSRWGC